VSAKPLLNKDQVAQLLNLTRRGVEGLVAQGKIPVLRISHRCVRFEWEKVSAALQRFEVREVGR
jgi:excisionase family DNA binding protein